MGKPVRNRSPRKAEQKLGEHRKEEGRNRNGASVHLGGPNRETEGKTSGIIAWPLLF